MIIKFLINKIYKFSIIFFITVLLLEISAKVLVHLGFLDKGLPSWVTLRPHEDFAHWHPKNVSLIVEKKNCWISKVTYNYIGMRKIFNYEPDKNENTKTIALLGDSMVENVEVDDGLDLGSSIQKKITSFKVLNFSARGTGLADQIEIYKKLIKPIKADYLFLFLTENDIYNNVNGFTTYYHKRYDIKNDKIIEIKKNQSFLKDYNSKKKIFFRDKLLYLKKLDLYKVYLKYHFIINIQKRNTNQSKTDNETEKKFDLSEKKKKIYHKIKKDFLNSIDANTNLYIFLNARAHIFNPNKDETAQAEFAVTNFLRDTWKNEANFYDPYFFTKEKLISLNKFNFPFLSMDCDAHYSRLGSNIFSEFVSESFLKSMAN